VINLLAAALFFVGIHLLVSGTTLRDKIVQRVGEQGFLGLFSLASLAGIVWLCWAYSSATPHYLFGEVAPLRWIVLVLVFLAFQFVVIGLTTPSPTATGGEAKLDDEMAAVGILRITRHPFLWGVAIWALAHAIQNGEAAALVLFGSLLALALLGPRSIDAKRARKFGDKWQRFAERTSNLPFAAIASGRNDLRLGELGWWRPAAATLAFGIFLGAHQWLFGVSPLPL
jgi:uncharacterized membrane protein